MIGLRVGVLVSGSGSNLQSILDAERAGRLGPATVVLVLSNRPGVLAIERARVAGVEVEVIDHRAFAGDRASFERALVERLLAVRVDLVVLAGFMRLLGKSFLEAFPGRVVNIHPALLPAFPGVDGQGQALRYGAKIAGCTVHFVDEGTDSGPVIAQAAVPVLDDDDEKALAARILAQEHRVLPRVIRWIAEGRVVREGRRVRIVGLGVSAGSHLRSPEPEDEA
ncbi:MAG: phosphoribosylglycinamide formyltransferase [Deltaproteobacteria bacterium]|nr:phosphoribosylglycinamide formyltransferase [Deltaproteobacteria bacterium]